MTKENKLALVVGFGLILLVGILVSDHFSAARSQEAADLLPAHDPLVDLDAARPELLNVVGPGGETPFRGNTTAGSRQLPIDTGSAGLVNTAPRQMPQVQAPDRRPQPLPQNDTRVTRAEQSPSTFRFHEVESGESLTTICRRYYGDDTQVLALARHNGLSNPDMLRAGARLRIPLAKGQLNGSGSHATPPAATNHVATRNPARTPATDAGRTPAATSGYTVKSGDVLSLIAQRELGSARLWHKLYQLNKDVIRDPDHLEVGTVLKFPPS